MFPVQALDAIGGWLAQGIGYPAAFLVLGCFAIGSIAIWLGFSPMFKPTCADKPDQAMAAVS